MRGMVSVADEIKRVILVVELWLTIFSSRNFVCFFLATVARVILRYAFFWFMAD